MAKALQRGQAARAAVEARLQRKGVHGAPRLANGKTVGQHAAPQAGERPRGGGAFSGWRGDGEGGKPFAADADTRVRRTIFDKNGGLQRACRQIEPRDILRVHNGGVVQTLLNALEPARRALSKSATRTIGSTGISCSQVTQGRSPAPRLSAGEGGKGRRDRRPPAAQPDFYRPVFYSPRRRAGRRRAGYRSPAGSTAARQKSCICWIRRSATEATTIRLFSAIQGRL